MGDGELYEGSVWESVMFAGHRRPANLVLIIDKNGTSMLDFCRNIIDLDPLDAKFKSFGWKTVTVSDGHDISALTAAFSNLFAGSDGPKVVIVETVKGKGVPSLEVDPMSHLRVLSDDEIDTALRTMS
jgi:transketolase